MTTTFLGIGASHVVNVYNCVYNALLREMPQAITLEKKMRFTNVGESCANERGRRARFEAGKCRVFYEREVGNVLSVEFDLGQTTHHHKRVKKVKLRVDEWYAEDGGSLENNPAFAYSQDNDIPIYFVDIPFHASKKIVEFRMSGYRIIDLEKEASLTKDIPNKDISFRGDHSTRNRFAADAINYLFRQGLQRIAHIGGTGHFNMNYSLGLEKWNPFPVHYKEHIQDLVVADRILILDTNTGKMHKMNPREHIKPPQNLQAASL